MSAEHPASDSPNIPSESPAHFPSVGTTTGVIPKPPPSTQAVQVKQTRLLASEKSTHHKGPSSVHSQSAESHPLCAYQLLADTLLLEASQSHQIAVRESVLDGAAAAAAECHPQRSPPWRSLEKASFQEMRRANVECAAAPNDDLLQFAPIRPPIQRTHQLGCTAGSHVLHKQPNHLVLSRGMA
eukprot:CAMPEP_0194503218 /NCGR_PEP_ID=MMETSP0253-20130528/28256_1 /TAXON_ID=2966 /ORGANISM="Noctiluca scintillans" /LENGTH=183 /DNA_ID=CAMNT_0039345479 /DNA_START=1096 /DNA_END=1648 /DNA_ORIENTATION=+